MKSLYYWMVLQVLVGIWLAISPYVLNFLGHKEIRTMTMNNLIFGAIVVILGMGITIAGYPALRHAEKKTS
ncbi:MAG: SPW repeat protein [Syntrophaceae bacterium]|nr:SPW repeat protein [Syntrophaceae bacterium]